MLYVNTTAIIQQYFKCYLTVIVPPLLFYDLPNLGVILLLFSFLALLLTLT